MHKVVLEGRIEIAVSDRHGCTVSEVVRTVSAHPLLLAAVSEEDPCGVDIRWDPDVLTLDNTLARLVEGDDGAIVGAEAVDSEKVSPESLLRTTGELLGRSKDLFVMGVHAQGLWLRDGLGAYAQAMDELVQAVERWPDPATGVHPRADPEDGDLGERVAVLARLLVNVPVLSSTVGWGKA